MPRLPIVTVNDNNPVLRAVAEPVNPEQLKSTEFQSFLNDLRETMLVADGVGIAATQVGVSQRVFVATGPLGVIIIINPKIVKRSWRRVSGEEGCLSIPGKYGKVKRHQAVTVRALDPIGQTIEISASGFFARVIQHENDHLDGILFTDRITEQGGKLP